MNVQTYWRSHDVSTAAPMPLIWEPALSARPTVFGATTSFWLERSMGRPMLIDVFDTRGRRVSRVQIPAGLRSMTWSARDDRGRGLASGRYYAQPVDARVRGIPLTIVR